MPVDTAEIGEPPEGQDDEADGAVARQLALQDVLEDEWLPGGADGALLSAAEPVTS